MPSRGSLTCRSMTSATISRTRMLILRVRAWSRTASSSTVVLRPDQSSVRRQEIDLGPPGREPLALVEHLAAVRRIGGDDRHSDRRRPVQVELANLCRRNVNPPLQLAHYRPDHRSLLLERVDVPEQHVELEHAYVQCRPTALGTGLLPQLEGLNDVVDLDVVVVAERYTALEPFADLSRIVLEPPEAGDGDVVRHDDAVADQPRLRVTDDGAAPHDATGDVADLGRPEHLADLGSAELRLLELRLEHALERALDVLDRGVDDRV